jgi:hypothetical protein
MGKVLFAGRPEDLVRGQDNAVLFRGGRVRRPAVVRAYEPPELREPQAAGGQGNESIESFRGSGVPAESGAAV